jgi:lipoate-protein ligase A
MSAAREHAAEAWDLWQDAERAPALNMAIDEALLEQAPGRGRSLLRLYGWDRPAVSIGCLQHHAAAPAAAGALVRRPTGGGVVFHGADVTYSVVLPPEHALGRLPRLECYARLNGAVRSALAACRLSGAALAATDIPCAVDRRTMVCFRTPTRYDVLLAGRKVAGSAQRRTRSGVLHQGSVHLGPAAAVSRADVGAALVAAFTRELGAAFAPFIPSRELEERAAELVRTRYGTDTWNRRL